MSNRNDRPSILLFSFHVIMTLVTGGAWLLLAGLWYLMKFAKNRRNN